MSDITSASKTGFSLVELSIVLVILGLLTGGILGGQSLMRAAELRSITTEFKEYQSAVNIFKDKYFAFPGDMPNATAFWGLEANCATVETNSHTTALSGGTCNGDGSGLITDNLLNSKDYEQFLFWHHLQLAGLITGQYSGVRGPAGTEHHILNENAPSSKLNNGGWSLFSWVGGNASWFDLDYGHVFLLGAQSTNARPRDPLLTPEEAWNIDTKMDDGKPGQGKVIARNWNNTCANAGSNTDYAADYRLSDSTVRCSVSFRQAF